MMGKELVVFKDNEEVARGEKEAEITGLRSDTEYKQGTFKVAFEEDGILSDFTDVPGFRTEVKIVEATGINLSPKTSTAESGSGGNRKLTASVVPQDATEKELEYSISPSTDGLGVDDSGMITWSNSVEPGEYVTTVSVKGTEISEQHTLTLEAPEDPDEEE